MAVPLKSLTSNGVVDRAVTKVPRGCGANHLCWVRHLAAVGPFCWPRPGDAHIFCEATVASGNFLRDCLDGVPVPVQYMARS